MKTSFFAVIILLMTCFVSAYANKSNKTRAEIKAESFYLKGEYDKAEQLYSTIYKENNLSADGIVDYACLMLMSYGPDSIVTIMDAINGDNVRELDFLVLGFQLLAQYDKVDSLLLYNPSIEPFDMSLLNGRSVKDYLNDLDKNDIISISEVPHANDFLVSNIDAVGKSGPCVIDNQLPNYVDSNLDSTVLHDAMECLSGYHNSMCYNESKTLMFVSKTAAQISDDPNADDINLHIYVSQVSRCGDWSEYVKLDVCPDGYSAVLPFVRENTLYFSSDMPGGCGGVDAYCVAFNDMGQLVTSVTNLGRSINSEYNELFSCLDSDGVVYFASDGYVGYGGWDNYKAIPQGNNSYEILNMGAPFNSAWDDMALTPYDDNSGFFASNRKSWSEDGIFRYEMTKDTPYTLAKGIW